MTSSPLNQILYAASEAWGDDASDEPGTLAEAMRSAAEAVREGSEIRREAASNIEDGFGHPTTQSEEFEATADGLEFKADELDGEADEIESEEFDSDDATDEAVDEVDRDGLDDQEIADAVKGLVDEKRTDWFDELTERAGEAVETALEVP